MAALTICSDFGTQKIVCHCFHCFPSICHEVMGLDAMILVFRMLSFKPTFLLSSFTSRGSFALLCFLPQVWCHLYIWCYWYFSRQCWYQLVLASSSLAFCMMYSANKLNKQGDNIKPWCTHFPIWNQSVVPCPVLTVASWPVYRFLRTQISWSGIPISWRIFHSLWWSTQSKTFV